MRILVAVMVVLAGCSAPQGTDTAATLEPGAIAGWVLDHTLAPVPGATVTVEGLGQASADEDGRFAVPGNLTRSEYVLVADAPGHRPASTVVAPAHAGQVLEVRLQLRPEPEEGFTRLQTFQGLIPCEVVAQVGHSHGTGNPDEDDRYACGPGLTGKRNFTIDVGPGASDMLMEIVWEPSTPRAEYLAFALFDEEGEVMVFSEGRSVHRIELGRLLVEDHFGAGRQATLKAYTGIAEDEPTEVYTGISIDQEFDIFLTTFYGETMPRGYSVL